MFELKQFKLPENFRGKPTWFVQLWWIVQATIFRFSPQFMYRWRNVLLILFGAKIGKGVIIRPTVTITYPWKLNIGDYSWIGDDVTLYTLGEIHIGSNTVISQKSYLCTGSHDFTDKNFSIYEQKIEIGDSCWIATDVFIAPGITICSESIVGARSSVFKSIQEKGIYYGNPLRKK